MKIPSSDLAKMTPPPVMKSSIGLWDVRNPVVSRTAFQLSSDVARFEVSLEKRVVTVKG